MNSAEPNKEDTVKQVVNTNQKFGDRRGVFIILTAIWVIMVGIGMSSLWNYQITPAEKTESPKQWPAYSLIKRNPARPALVMFAHPRCPCTRASICELALLMTHCGEHVDASVLFFTSPKFETGWEKTDLWHSAAAIPGVTVACDPEGLEAKKFRSTTSGYVVLYDAKGQLMFQGGITGSRGHAGENVGRSLIEAILMNKTTGTKKAFVYGCPLLDQNDASGKETQQCPQQ